MRNRITYSCGRHTFARGRRCGIRNRASRAVTEASCRTNFGTQRIGMDCMVEISWQVKWILSTTIVSRTPRHGGSSILEMMIPDQVSQKSRAGGRYQFRAPVRSRSASPTKQEVRPAPPGKEVRDNDNLLGHVAPSATVTSPHSRYCII